MGEGSRAGTTQQHEGDSAHEGLSAISGKERNNSVQNNSVTLHQHQAWPSTGESAGTEGIVLPTSPGLALGVFVMHPSSGTDQYVPLAHPQLISNMDHPSLAPKDTAALHAIPSTIFHVKNPTVHALHRLQTSNTYFSPPQAPFLLTLSCLKLICSPPSQAGIISLSALWSAQTA